MEKTGKKVISLSRHLVVNSCKSEIEDNSDSFRQAIRRNVEQQEKVKKERFKANQRILKAYRIKK